MQDGHRDKSRAGSLRREGQKRFAKSDKYTTRNSPDSSVDSVEASTSRLDSTPSDGTECPCNVLAKRVAARLREASLTFLEKKAQQATISNARVGLIFLARHLVHG